MKQLWKALVLACLGGVLYFGIEAVFKGINGGGRLHWSMGVIGGVMFLAVGAINEVVPWCMPLIRQAILGGVLITAVELAAGLILNLWLGLHIWDYSNLPFQFLGQISLPFSLVWVLLAGIAIVLDDWLRHWIWGEARPHYWIWRCPKEGAAGR